MIVSDRSVRPNDDVVKIASRDVAVTVDVSNGAKITSLCDRIRGREWLLQAADAASTGRPRYGSVFTEESLAGWDEMFPTVDACRLDNGVELPDHGEVWSRPWRIQELTSTSLVCEIYGVAVDYRLQRRLEVSGPTVSLDYHVETTCQGTSALWAAHPQFAVGSGTMLELPPGVKSLDARLAGASDPFQRVDVIEGVLDWGRIIGPGQGMMFYVDPTLRIDQIRLIDGAGASLVMTWNSDDIPYFAVWIDNGRYAPAPVICPEPMSGYYDSLRRAQDGRRVREVTAETPIEWTVHLTVGGNRS